MKTNLLFSQASALSKRLAMLLTMLFTIGVGSMLGATASFAPSDFSGQGSSGTGSAISATVDGVTFACDKGYGTTQIRCYSGGKITISSSNTITAISFTFSKSYEGGLNTSYTELSTTSWEITTSSQARITACTVTYTAASSDPYTVTFDACSGTCDTESLTEYSAGAGVTLPEAEIDCGDVNWEFAGWSEASVDSETTAEPTLYKAGETYKPATDCPLYAVYKRTEGDGESSEDVTFTFSEIASANSWTNGTAYTTVTISPITITANGGGNNGKYYTSNTSWRMYNGGSVNITTSVGEITAVSSNPSKDFTITDGSASLSFSATTEFKSITVTYSSSNSTTYYHSTPECTTETVSCLHANA